MKKIISLILAIALVLSCSCISFATSQNKVLQTVKALGIMVGDENGNMNVDSYLTRAQFAKMLVAASGVSNLSDKGTGFSLFSDVSKDYWAGRYIYQVAKKGLLVGYSDAKFGPEDKLTVEQTCAGVIRLLGYSSNDLVGSYPDCYMDKADELGLLDNVSASTGDYITRGECAYIFYNALMAQDSSGKVFGTSLGCTVSNGSVSYTVSKSESDDTDGIYVGIITSITKDSSSSSSTGVATDVTALCADGVTRSFSFDKSVSYTVGQLVQVKISDGDSSISSLYSKRISGKVNKTGSYLGDYKLADEIGIIDCDSYGNAQLVDIEDIAGLDISYDDVKYYGLNSAGAIETLVLNDVTGKLWTTVYMTAVDTSTSSGGSSGISLSGTYSYLLNGESKTLHTSDVLYSVQVGGAQIKFSSSGEAQSMKSLSSATINSLSSSEALCGNVRYAVSDDVQIYVKNGTDYYLTDIDTVDEGFTLKGWYTKVGSTPSIVVIIATK